VRRTGRRRAQSFFYFFLPKKAGKTRILCGLCGLCERHFLIKFHTVNMNDGSKVQNGTIPISTAQTSNTASISTINTTLAMPYISYSINDSANNARQDSGNFVATYLDSTTLQVSRFNTESISAEVDYLPVEFASWSAANTSIPSGNFALGGMSPGGQTYDFDWVKIRKFVNPEPGLTLGSELLP
jgi:hypothetical protein